MRRTLRSLTITGIAAWICVGTCLSVPALPLSQIQRAEAATDQEEKKEPTFEETRDFILKYSRGAWEDTEGNRHTYLLSFVNKKLKIIHSFTSKFVPGFVEKIEVVMSDLDPTLVGKDDESQYYFTLATTEGARKISVEVTMLGPTAGPTQRKYLFRMMATPGADAASEEDRDKLNGRLKKAWAHLIKLAGGKVSQKEPF